jgi:hypothetical protein
MTPDSIIALDGVEQPIREHALDWGIPPELIVSRIDGGWDVRAAIETPMPLPGDRKAASDVDRKIQLHELKFLNELRRSKRRASQTAARTYTHNGLTLTVKEWAQQLGLRQETIYLRLRRGRPLDQTLSRAKLPIHPNARTYTHNGLTLTLREWSEHLGVSIHALQYRLNSGYSFEAVFSQSRPANHNCRMIEFNGETRSASDWCRLKGIDRSTFHNRIEVLGWSVERAIMTPPRKKREAKLPVDRPGVGQNSADRQGTGGRSFARDSAKLEFSE